MLYLHRFFASLCLVLFVSLFSIFLILNFGDYLSSVSFSVMGYTETIRISSYLFSEPIIWYAVTIVGFAALFLAMGKIDSLTTAKKIFAYPVMGIAFLFIELYLGRTLLEIIPDALSGAVENNTFFSVYPSTLLVYSTICLSLYFVFKWTGSELKNTQRVERAIRSSRN